MLTAQDVYDRLELGFQVGDDPASDAFVTRQIAAVQTAIRDYTGRRITRGSYEDWYTRPDKIFVRDLPFYLSSPAPAIEADGVVLTYGTDWWINLDTGQVLRMYDSADQPIVRHDGSWGDARIIKFTYHAGYDAQDIPEDILQVFDFVIGTRWNKRAATGTVAGGIGTGQTVKRVSMADVGAIDYDNTSDAKSGSSSEVAGDWLAGFPLASLDKYRNLGGSLRYDLGAYNTHTDSMVTDP